MRCPCGANDLLDDARFCAYCGVPVAAGAVGRPMPAVDAARADAETIIVRATPADATPAIGTPVELSPPAAEADAGRSGTVQAPEPAAPETAVTPPVGTPAQVAPTVGAPADATPQVHVPADATPPIKAATPPTGPASTPPPPSDASPAPVRLDVAEARVYDQPPLPTPPPSPDASVATHLRPVLGRLLRGPALLAAAAGALATALLMVLVAVLLWQALPATNRSLLGIPSNLSELRGSLAVWTTLHGIGGAAEGAGDTPLLGPLLALAAAAAGGVAAMEVLGRDRPARDRRIVAVLMGVLYALIGLVLVAVSREGNWEPNAFAALPACGAIGALGALVGTEAWHRRRRPRGDAGHRPDHRPGLGSVVARTLRLLALGLAATLVVGLVGNALAIGSGEETDGEVGGWYAGLYAIEHAVSLFALGLGALAERAGVLGAPLLLDDVEALPQRFRITDLDAALPTLAHIALVLLLAGLAYGVFALAGHRAARAAGPAVGIGPLLVRWAVVTAVLTAAILALVALAYPVIGDDTTFGPRPASVLGWSLLGGGAAAFAGLVLGAPNRVVRDAAGSVTTAVRRVRDRRDR